MQTYACYGKKYGKLATCADCECASYCAGAADLPAGSGPELNPDINPDKSAQTTSGDSDSGSEEKRYSLGEMIFMLKRVLRISDPRIRDLVLKKLENPDITLSEIAKSWGVRKQMVRKDIETACFYFPELAEILQNRPMYNRWRGHEKKELPARSSCLRDRHLKKGVFRDNRTDALKQGVFEFE